MRRGDLYQHYKDIEYCFIGIALPLDLVYKPLGEYRSVRYHENTHDVLLCHLNEALFIDAVVPHVIYQSRETGIMWAREVDDFFGHTEIIVDEFLGHTDLVKRFTLKVKGAEQ